MTQDSLKKEIKKIYGSALEAERDLCSTEQEKLPDDSCCTCDPGQYSMVLDRLPASCRNFSLGCGNPLSYHNLQSDDIVVDIGSGAGLDVMLAALKVPRGKAVGIDFTMEVVKRGRENAALANILNAEFLLAEIENLPLFDDFASLVISNCVVNLLPDKERAFQEIARILKPGGFLLISDIVSKEPIPEKLRNDPKLWSSCISGAIPEYEYLSLIRKSGIGGLAIFERTHIDVSGLKLFSITVKGLKHQHNSALKLKNLKYFDTASVFLIPEEPFWFKTSARAANLLRMSSPAEGESVYKSLNDQDFEAELQVREIAANDSSKSTYYSGRGKFIKPETLSELWLHITQQCNLQCIHCLISSTLKKEDILSVKELVNLIEEAQALGVKRFYLTGGEPFLRKDIIDIIELITQKTNLVILTNGTLIKPYLSRLSQNQRLLLQVSLESHLPEIHETIRGKGSFEPALEGIKSLVSYGLNPVIATTLTRINAPYMAKTAHYLSQLGVKHLHILFLHPRGRAALTNKLTISAIEASKTMRNLKEVASKLNISIDNFKALQARLTGKRALKYDLCIAGYEILAIGNNGQIYPCPALVGSEEFSCGSLRNKSLRDIWLNSAATKRIRAESLSKNDKCRTCDMRFFCGAGCISFKYFSTGRLDGLDPYCKVYYSMLQTELKDLSSTLECNSSNFQTSMRTSFDQKNTVKGFHCA